MLLVLAVALTAPLGTILAALLAGAGLLTAIALPEPPGPYLWMMGAGFVIGIWGQGARLPIMVAIGIALVMVTTVLLFLASQDLGARPLPSV